MSKHDLVRIDFKQRVMLGKKPYGPGEVEIDISALPPHEVKFLHKMIETGLALEPKSKPVEVITEAERSKRLAEKILGEKKLPRGPNPDHHSLPIGSEAQATHSEDEKSSEEASSDESEEGEELGEESASEAEEPAEEEAAPKKSKKKKKR